jgi:hypothetical protein
MKSSMRASATSSVIPSWSFGAMKLVCNGIVRNVLPLPLSLFVTNLDDFWQSNILSSGQYINSCREVINWRPEDMWCGEYRW